MPEREFRSFGELAGAVEQERERERAEIKDLYDEVLAGRFAQVPSGAFTTDLERMPWVMIVRPEGAPKGKESLNVRATYLDRQGQERAFDGSIFESSGSGIVAGKFPQDFPASQEALSREVLRVLDRVNVGFWRLVDERIFPTADPQEFAGEEPTEPKVAGPPRVDPERLEFLTEQPHALFGFVSREKGFRGYHGVVLPDRLLLEHPTVGNAAFIMRLDPPMSFPAPVFTRKPEERLGQTESARILAERVKPLLKSAPTKQSLRALGARRVVHTPQTWKQRLRAAIEGPLA